MSLVSESELSGFARLIGYRLVRWEPDFAEVVLDLGIQHLNRGGVAHGGALTSLIEPLAVTLDAGRRRARAARP